MSGCTPYLGTFAAQASVVLRKGDAWKRRVSFKDGTSTGSPINLTGATFAAIVVRAADPSTEIGTATATLVDAAGGLVDLSLSLAQQQPLTPGVYDKDPDGAYEILLRLTDAFGDVFSVLRLKLQLVV